MIISPLKFLLDSILPRFCTGCNKKLSPSVEFVCSTCYSKFELANEERINEEFDRKFCQDLLISDFCSAFVFHNDSVIQDLIHSLKYEQNFQIGKYLGSQTSQILKEIILNWRADFIIPIPLHHLRKAERGFNQSLEIARGVSSNLKMNVKNNILKRNRFTKTQTKFSLQERKSNIQGAFSINNKKKIVGKSIILVDDVITTGATTRECAKILIENGALNVYALSVAIAE